jgi:hypothetical protein
VKKLLTLITLSCLFFPAQSQVKPFGIIDTADLKLTSCDFEKDANAEVLFSRRNVHLNFTGIRMQYHKRIKIFNLQAGKLGNISIDFYNDNLLESISNLQAETFNLESGKLVVKKLSKNDFFRQKINAWISRYTFSMPDIKAGSVIEYSYTRYIHYSYDPPDWHFQDKFPVRYSESSLSVPRGTMFQPKLHVSQRPVISTDTMVTLSNIPSLQHEPYMDSYEANLQSLSYYFSSDEGPSGKRVNTDASWQQIGASLIFSKKYGEQLKNQLDEENKWVDAVRNRPPADKIAYLFNKVRDTMHCDHYPDFYPHQQLNLAWKFRMGNASDINMILCRLLTQSGVPTCPVAVSTDEDDRIDSHYATRDKFDRTIAYATVNGRNYVLDASEKDNQWFSTPYNLLNSLGLYMDVNQSVTGLIRLEANAPAKNMVFIDGELTPEGQMKGIAQITSSGYYKTDLMQRYKEDGEKKYKEYLAGENNDLFIDSLELNNKKPDTLPLVQRIRFNLKLASANEQYIYFNPNQFTSLTHNPFLSEKRYSDIDLAYRRNYTIGGRFKIPAGYNADVIPKNVTLMMPDKSISFVRVADVQVGYIVLRYTINYGRSYFSKDEYQDIREFYRKMYDMLNEEVVLKKS